jgi:hypothetical protein
MYVAVRRKRVVSYLRALAAALLFALCPQDAEQALATYRKMIEASRQKKRQSLETETP